MVQRTKIQLKSGQWVEAHVYTVDERTMKCEPHYIDGQQTLMGLLKKMGAPVQGLFKYKVREGWTVKREDDPVRQEMVFWFYTTCEAPEQRNEQGRIIY